MAFATMINYMNSHGRFPREVDPSGWLDVLNWMLTAEEARGSYEKDRPLRVGLRKYIDNQSAEWTAYQIAEVPSYYGKVTMNPLPFLAGNDRTALAMLREKIDRFNQGQTKPVFVLGNIEESIYHPEHSGQLLRMGESQTIDEAMMIFDEGANSFR